MNKDEMLSPPTPQLLYEPIQKDKVHPSQRRYFAKVGSMFTEHMAVRVDVLYKIHAIVKSKECTNRQLYYQYYDICPSRNRHTIRILNTPYAVYCILLPGLIGSMAVRHI